ncbi:hypothetical protein [Ferruginibacter sp. HRS2-29]|uniref:hypothetical protein n=1 Tax=Ferruginibacter sp. HRS2-29 TaxID=2487334 RepID=UPI0020CCA494|nr:hypothetical protein [Ferruginibacter sp. HRS2-29]MCP9751010.1 hypothetical protein [Ferruginibacter sp. HRS2-29]
MKRKLLFLGLFVLPFLIKAQVTIQVQLPPAGLLQKDQLWNVILMNNKDDVLDVHIRLSLQDATTGQVYMSATSGSVLLGKGVKILKQQDVQPAIFNYTNPDFSRNYLPIGNYIICYQVYTSVGENQVMLGDECSRINIDPLSPPLLNTPADGTDISTPYPQFTWLPPSPMDMFSNLSYDLLVAEVLPGQSPTEAIQYNTPIYSANNLRNTNHPYSSAYAALDTGKWYAWQVVALNGSNYAAKTEVWTFKRTGNPVPPPVSSGTYILLKDNLTGTYIVEDGILRIKYFSYAKDYKSTILFSNEKDKVVKGFVKIIIPGENYFDFDVSRGFQKGKTYKVTIKDQQDVSHFLKFSIK